ncbi:MAG: DUF2309 domain-containing protein [Planctomycetales bacterium]|nr:DUF2309 domain-containing protein [Planctomycetales bacterium]
MVHTVEETESSGTSLTALEAAIERAAHLLPSQGPIEVFVHHNTLHAFEELPFEEAVLLGHEVFGGQPYWSEDRYRGALAAGRIRTADLEAVLLDELGDDADVLVGAFGPLYQLRLAMLRSPLRSGTAEEISWAVAQTDGLTHFLEGAPQEFKNQTIAKTRKMTLAALQGHADGGELVNDSWFASFCRAFAERTGSGRPESWSDGEWESFALQLLWQTINEGVAALPEDPPGKPLSRRLRDLVMNVTGVDVDEQVNETLIRFNSLYADQGLADWEIANRSQGYFRCFIEYYARLQPAPSRWLRAIRAEARRLAEGGVEALESIDESLIELGVSPEARSDYILQTLLALPGWAGMLHQLETLQERLQRPVGSTTLTGYLAARLVLERIAYAQAAEETLGLACDLSELRTEMERRQVSREATAAEQRAFEIFQLAQYRGWNPLNLLHLSGAQWERLVDAIEDFGPLERRRTFHRAYERNYRHATLDALIARAKQRLALETHENSSQKRRSGDAQVPTFQIVCCIDDREESFRRHLEEIEPRCETFGAAGFFAVAMNYQGVADVGFKALCPVIITPEHYVTEDVGYTFQGEHKRRADARRAIGHLRRQAHWKSRTFLGGVVTGVFGSAATIPLVARVLLPRLTAQLRRRWGSFIQPPPVTQLQLERYRPEPGPDNGHVGYTVDEMTNIVERLLRDMGVVDGFSRLFIVMGHGSSSINNPHESAYNCGACAGKRGGPNARAFAQMANDWRVRSKLAERGVKIPDQTTFVGAFHNTCSDGVEWFDLDRLTASHHADFEHAKTAIDEARRRNAHERARRFATAPLALDAEAALRHVEGRAEDLSQVRPEYNHATNALCFVGRRTWSRSLFFDRRAFLTSYDPAVDDDQHSVLFRILAAAIPVCAGINLEYYFSCADPIIYGAGSKLPHNVVALLGVMEGAASDLRTGLYEQMVEIHEPMRILFVVETTPAALLDVMQRHEGIRRLCEGGWVQLAAFDPASAAVQLFEDGAFRTYRPESEELPRTETSLAWYRGNRDNLPVALVAASECGREEQTV